MTKRIFPHEDRIFMRFDPLLESTTVKQETLQKIIDDVSYLPQASERLVESNDLTDDHWPEITKMQESVSAKYGKFKQGGGVIKRFRKYLSQSMNGLEVTDIVFSKPRKNGIFVFVTAQFKISDGQTITAYFHAPEAEKATLTPQDLLVSYRFTINKLDVTGAIVRSTGKDLPATKMARIIGGLVSDNKENFASKKAAREERATQLANLQAEYKDVITGVEDLMGELSQFEVQDKDISQETETLKRDITNKEFQLQDLLNQIDGLGGNKQPVKEDVDMKGKDESSSTVKMTWTEFDELAKKHNFHLTIKDNIAIVYKTRLKEHKVALHDGIADELIIQDKEGYNALINGQSDKGLTDSTFIKITSMDTQSVVDLKEDRFQAYYNLLEEDNQHMEALVLQAKRTGVQELIDNATKVKGYIDRDGEVKASVGVMRDIVSARINTKLDSQGDKGEAEPTIDEKGDVTLEGLFLSDGWVKDTKSKIGGFIKVVNGDKYKIKTGDDLQYYILVRNRKNTMKYSKAEDSQSLKRLVDKAIQAEEDRKAKKKDWGIQVDKAIKKGLELISESLAKLGWESKEDGSDIRVSKNIGSQEVSATFKGGLSTTSLMDNKLLTQTIEMANIYIDKTGVGLDKMPNQNFGTDFMPEDVNQFKGDELANSFNDAVNSLMNVSNETEPQPANEGDGGSNAVIVANDILGGKFDDDPADLEAAFESILDELDQSNPDLLEQVSNYYTNILAVMA